MATTEKGIYYPSDYSANADIPADMKAMAESIEKTLASGGVEGAMIYKGNWRAGIAYPVGSVVYEQGVFYISINGTVTSYYPSENPEYWKILSVVDDSST